MIIRILTCSLLYHFIFFSVLLIPQGYAAEISDISTPVIVSTTSEAPTPISTVIQDTPTPPNLTPTPDIINSDAYKEKYNKRPPTKCGACIQMITRPDGRQPKISEGPSPLPSAGTSAPPKIANPLHLSPTIASQSATPSAKANTLIRGKKHSTEKKTLLNAVISWLQGLFKR